MTTGVVVFQSPPWAVTEINVRYEAGGVLSYLWSLGWRAQLGVKHKTGDCESNRRFALGVF